MTATRPTASGIQHSAFSIWVNGDRREIPGESRVADLIQSLGLRPELVAVEINRELIQRSAFSERPLRQDDRVEIVEFVGGG